MPLKNYGVLKGRAIASRTGVGQSPHYQIHIIDQTTDYRIAINIKSQLSPSELLYLVEDDYDHPLLDRLADLDLGFTELNRGPGGLSLDYIRANLFDRNKLKPLPHDLPGPDNDLNEKIDGYIQRAIRDEEALIYAFGERWGPEANQKDKYFGFLPGNGIHDIHMNQGNAGRFVQDDGVWQDGGLLIQFPAIQSNASTSLPTKWVAIFLAFQSQSFHTDDVTGHRIDSIEQPPKDGRVRIVAASVNPAGADPGHETVTLINVTDEAIDLTGWALADRNKRQSILAVSLLAAGEAVKVELDGSGAQLSNKGGVITLLDSGGLKVDGVSYTRSQARQQGWTIVF